MGLKVQPGDDRDRSEIPQATKASGAQRATQMSRVSAPPAEQGPAAGSRVTREPLGNTASCPCLFPRIAGDRAALFPGRWCNYFLLGLSLHLTRRQDLGCTLRRPQQPRESGGRQGAVKRGGTRGPLLSSSRRPQGLAPQEFQSASSVLAIGTPPQS